MTRYAIRSTLFWLLLAPLIVANLFPFAVMFFTAVKPGAEVLSAAPSWLPSRFAWENFATMWAVTSFGYALWNSIVVGVVTTGLTVLVAVPAAYAIARMEFRGKGAFQNFLLMTKMLSPLVLVVGLFRLVVALHALDSVVALSALYVCFNTCFSVWMLRSYFASLPAELEEAAWLEGASRARAVCTVFLPMAAPAVAVTAIFTFIAAWNEYALALSLLRSEGSYTLPLRIVALVNGRYEVEWHHVMAATFVATVPVAAVFIWLQRHLVGGLAAGAVK